MIVRMSVIVVVTGHFNAFLGSAEMVPRYAALRREEHSIELAIILAKLKQRISRMISELRLQHDRSIP
jgi:hypothetical protein